jgi:hypothetical protein
MLKIPAAKSKIKRPKIFVSEGRATASFVLQDGGQRKHPPPRISHISVVFVPRKYGLFHRVEQVPEGRIEAGNAERVIMKE